MDVWKVSIALAMSSNHNAVLGALSSRLLGVNAQVNQLQGGFGKLKGVIAGALAVTAGVALFDVMAKLVDKTREYSDELVALQRLGGGIGAAAANGDISRRAFDIAQRVPMKVTDLMKIPGATYSIMGEEHAMAMWESMAKFSWVLQSQKGYGGDTGADLQKLMRAGELSGRFTDKDGNFDKGRADHFLDLAARIVAATHGMVNPDTMLGMAKQGGFTLRGLSDEGFYSQAIAAQAMGGPRSGTALLSLWQQMAGGTMMSRSAKGLEDIGLLKPGEWQNDHGRVILGEGASKRLTSLIGKDPMDLAANIVNNLKERGVTDPEQQMRMVARALGRQTTQRYTAEEVTNFQQILAERDRMRQGMGVESSFGLINNQSVTANMTAMKNAWDNLLTAIAGPNSENVIRLMQTLTGAINTVTAAVNRMDPATLSSIGIGLGVLAGALVAGGGAAILAALGTGGWLVAGIAGLAGVLTIYGPEFWGRLKSDWAASVTQFSQTFDQIKIALASFVEYLASVPGKIGHIFGIDPGGSFSSPGKTGHPAKPMMFEPGQTQMKATPISLSLNVDGRTLAQVVSDKIDALYRYETNAPAFNGAGRFA